tara:strand:+ start:512 stop:1528 length:1017 start_codon:yes stop_codon:yes gene_type:complete
MNKKNSNLKINTCLIIGSNSFIGSSFVDFLLSKKYKVIGVSRSNQPSNIFLKYKKNINIKNFSFIKLDLNNNSIGLVNLIKKFKPKYIVNYSAQGMVAESWNSPLDWYKTNVMSQIEFIEAIKNFDFIKKYVHFTTPEVYGSTKKWIKESFDFNPSTPYANSRASTDFHLFNLFRYYKFPVIFTRAANVYGPHQQLYRIIPKSLSYAILGKQLPLHGGGLSRRSFIYIEDVNLATYKILLKGKIGETYHISSNILISIKNLVFKIAKISNINKKNLVKIVDERLGKDQDYSLSSKKIRSELDWKDLINLDHGIKLTQKWVKDNIDEIKKMSFNYKHKK